MVTLRSIGDLRSIYGEIRQLTPGEPFALCDAAASSAFSATIELLDFADMYFLKFISFS
jgi:hypothetical protein